jgi:hypothetical protein
MPGRNRVVTDPAILTTACSRCRTEVKTYPPEDGNGPALCGRCAGTPTAVVVPMGTPVRRPGARGTACARAGRPPGGDAA